MKKALCWILCALTLCGGVPAGYADAYDDSDGAPVWYADNGAEYGGGVYDSGAAYDSDGATARLYDGDTARLFADGDDGNSDGGASDAGDSGHSDGGDSGDSGETEPIVLTQLEAPERAGWGRDYRFLVGRAEVQDDPKPDTGDSGNSDASDTGDSASDTGNSDSGASDGGDSGGASGTDGANETTADDEDSDEPPYARIPGMMYWTLNEDTQKRYRLDVYRRDEDEGNVLVESAEEWSVSEDSGYASSFRFLWDARDSGDYYFTIRALGDGLTYSDSETTQSEVWTYEEPDEQLTTPARPHWKIPTQVNVAVIDPPDTDTDEEGAKTVDGRYRIGYQARWWFAKELPDPTWNSEEADEDAIAEQKSKTTPRNIGTLLTFYPNHLEFQPTPKMLGEYGNGYYSVQIRALSRDITKAGVSNWSEVSAARYIASENTDLADIVARVDENTDAYNRQLAIENVRAFGTEKLYELMAADVNNTGAAGELAKLETMLGSQAKIVVSGDMETVFPPSSLSVIGAGLNVDLGESVTFNLGPAHSEETLPSLYGHAYRFSMQLSDKNGDSLTMSDKPLAVPIKLTIPIPASINPRFFVLLHHRADGTVETLPAAALRKDGEQWRASFIVMTFSDFTVAEQGAFLDAARESKGVTAVYRFRGDAAIQTALCVAEDASGRLCGAATLEPSEVTATALIVCDGVPARVRLFLLDAQYKPVFSALSADVRDT